VLFGAPFFMLVGGGGTWVRRSVSAGLGTALPVGLLLLYNVATTGHVFHPGYDWQYQREATGYPTLNYNPEWGIEDPRYLVQNLGIMFLSTPAIAPEVAPETLGDGAPVKRDPAHGFPFSMKDLALPDHLPALRAAGVSCVKVEGRKKSPLYVATTTDYYRKLLDGRLAAGERAIQEADLQTVFSRPWTRLFTESHKDKEVADRDTVGHRGTPIGKLGGGLASVDATELGATAISAAWRRWSLLR